MAKTSKTVKRAATSSSSKGSVGKNSTVKKKGFLGRSFNLQSRKVQFFVVILIVAILGGGYFTFKSFAATVVATYNRSSNSLFSAGNSGTCQIVPATADSAKNSPPVWSLACTPYPNNLAAVSVYTSNFLYSRNSSNVYRYCVDVKGKFTNELRISAEGTVKATDGDIKPLEVYRNMNLSNYSRLCGKNFQLSGVSGKVAGYVKLYSSTNDSSWINISNVVLEQVSYTPGSTPVK